MLSASEERSLLTQMIRAYQDDATIRLSAGTHPAPQDARSFLEFIDQAGLTVRVDRPPSADASSTGKLGRYPVTGHLGEGGMGQILQVRDDEVGRDLAAKVIKGRADPQLVAKFVREGQVTGQLEHPNIVPMHELGMTDDGQIYFTMKRIEGTDLAALLALSSCGEDRKLFEYLQILLKVCDAMSLAHSRGVIHRDLKPANIMVGVFGEVQVMDWGLARLVGQPDTAEAGCTLDLGGGLLDDRAQQGVSAEALQTLDGTVVGTPCYMPPEQARGEVSTLGRRSDVYALGAILYQMLTLELPFEDQSVWAVLQQVIEGQLIPPSTRTPQRDIPRELEAVVFKAMAATPARRYDTVELMKRDIEAYLEGRLLEAADYNAWQVVKKWAARHKAAVMAAFSIFGALVVGFVVAEVQRRKAVGNARKLERKSKDFDQLSDVQNLREMLDEADKLWPRRPEQVDKYRAWLKKARKLAGRMALHAATIKRIRALEQPTQAQKVLLGALSKLVDDIKELESPKQHGNTIVGVTARLAFAQQLRDRETADGAAWVNAVAAIRGAQVYQRLVVKPVAGLVPLGPDPTTKLWEFAHLGSGKPARRKNGKLVIEEATGLVLVLIPPGSFMMGAQQHLGMNHDPQARPEEQPVHPMTLRAFYISKYEMTQAQWVQVAGRNPSFYLPGTKYGPKMVTWRNPAEQVSWLDCAKLVQKIGLQLPTETQWEYAARAGTQTIWPYGNSLSDLQGKANIADRTGKRSMPTWDCTIELEDGHVVHSPVGSFLANRWGLFDVTGNVWEWCRDRYTRSYSVSAARGPDGLRKLRRLAGPAHQTQARVRPPQIPQGLLPQILASARKALQLCPLGIFWVGS